MNDLTPSEEKTAEERAANEMVDAEWMTNGIYGHKCPRFVREIAEELFSLRLTNQRLEAEVERMKKRLTAKVICLCGSTRFTGQMLVKQWELTKQGYIVVSWCALPDSYFAGEDKTHIGDQEGVKEIVDEVHKRKIDLCDEVFVLNIGDYVGSSTMSEIQYAFKIGKPIRFLETPRPRNPQNVNDPDLPQPFPWELESL